MKYHCDRCGGNTHTDDDEDWLDMAGNCEGCGDDLCPTCASDWPGGGPICERCYIEELMDSYLFSSSSDEHFFLGKEVQRLRDEVKSLVERGVIDKDEKIVLMSRI